MDTRSILAVSALALVATACADAPTVPARPSLGPQFSVDAGSEGQTHLVRFSNGAPSNFTQRVASLGGAIVWSHAGAGVAAVHGLTASGAASLKASGGIKAVVADQSFDLGLPSAPDVTDAAIESPTNPAGALAYARQWNMRQIQADVAWAAGHLGDPGVDVAILDTGIGYTHADLAGLVDMARSANFLPPGNFDHTVRQAVFPAQPTWIDVQYHGTHVAATVSSNAVALAGVTSRTTLIAVKVCGVTPTGNGSCPFSAVIGGLLHAADVGADVANLSLGGGFLKAKDLGLSDFIDATFNYVRNTGMTIVVSAGNESLDLQANGNFYKTYCHTPATICVSATGPTSRANSVNGPWFDIDAFAGYSNYGANVINVAAPGGNGTATTLTTFVHAACSPFSLVIPACQGPGLFVVGITGTSMAAPHVSGTAALLVQQLGRDPGAIRARLQQSADDLGKPGTDDFYGEGRINVARAVGAL